jgi:type I restriction enzyme S subunit
MGDRWREVTLGEIAEIVIGRTPPRDKLEYWTDNMDRPFCTIADMTDATVIPRREGVTTLAELEGKARRVPAGSLLMSFKLTLGRVGFAGIDLFPNEAIAWLRCAVPDVSERYLALWLSALDMDEFAGRAVKGKTLNGPSLRALPVIVPPLDEQRRIVDVITAVDEAIEAAEAERVMAHQAGEAISNLALTGSPAKQLTELRDLAEREGLIGGPFGSSLKTKDYAPSGVPVINGTNHSFEDWYLRGPYRYVSEEKARELHRNLAQPGDIVATNQGTVGQVSLVPEGSHPRYVVSQRQLRLRPRTDVALPEYLLVALRGTEAQAELASQVIATGVPHINLRIFGALRVPIPDLETQREIVAVIGASNACALAARSHREELVSLRSALLDDLLSGKQRIPSSYDELLSA